MDAELFKLAIEAAVTVERERGIGTLSEGVLHSAIKYYYQPDPGLHEVKIGGFICDAIAENHRLGRTVIEVQTSSFRNLKKKLTAFLGEENEGDKTEIGVENQGNSGNLPVEKEKKPLSAFSGMHEAEFPGRVTVVYPLESTKRIVWVAPDTGETTLGRKSPVGFIPARCLWELYNLVEFVGRKGFTFVILGMEMTEQKLLCGWSKDKKRGARRVCRIPLELTHELVFEGLEDYARLIPEELGDRFTAKDFCKAVKMTSATGNAALYCLMRIGVIERKRVGRAYVYFLTV